MIRFAVGEKVVIRFGRHQGQRGTVMESQAADVYKVRLENGFVLYYSKRGLAKDE